MTATTARPDISIRHSDGRMTVGAVSVQLTRKEQVLAVALWDAWPGSVTRAVLLAALGYHPGCDTHVDAAHLSRLRKKLKPTAAHVVNTAGEGYRLEVTP